MVYIFLFYLESVSHTQSGVSAMTRSTTFKAKIKKGIKLLFFSVILTKLNVGGGDLQANTTKIVFLTTLSMKLNLLPFSFTLMSGIN